MNQLYGQYVGLPIAQAGWQGIMGTPLPPVEGIEQPTMQLPLWPYQNYLYKSEANYLKSEAEVQNAKAMTGRRSRRFIQDRNVPNRFGFRVPPNIAYPSREQIRVHIHADTPVKEKLPPSTFSKDFDFYHSFDPSIKTILPSSIEEIIGQRLGNDGKVEYLTKLKDTSYEHLLWLDTDDLSFYENHLEVIEAFSKIGIRQNRPYINPEFISPEAVLDIRDGGNELQVLVKWSGLSFQYCTWEIPDVFGIENLIEVFKNMTPLKDLCPAYMPARNNDMEFLNPHQVEVVNTLYRRFFKSHSTNVAGNISSVHYKLIAGLLKYIRKMHSLYLPSLYITDDTTVHVCACSIREEVHGARIYVIENDPQELEKVIEILLRDDIHLFDLLVVSHDAFNDTRFAEKMNSINWLITIFDKGIPAYTYNLNQRSKINFVRRGRQKIDNKALFDSCDEAIPFHNEIIVTCPPTQSQKLEYEEILIRSIDAFKKKNVSVEAMNKLAITANNSCANFPKLHGKLEKFREIEENSFDVYSMRFIYNGKMRVLQRIVIECVSTDKRVLILSSKPEICESIEFYFHTTPTPPFHIFDCCREYPFKVLVMLVEKNKKYDWTLLKADIIIMYEGDFDPLKVFSPSKQACDRPPSKVTTLIRLVAEQSHEELTFGKPNLDRHEIYLYALRYALMPKRWQLRRHQNYRLNPEFEALIKDKSNTFENIEREMMRQEPQNRPPFLAGVDAASLPPSFFLPKKKGPEPRLRAEDEKMRREQADARKAQVEKIEKKFLLNPKSFNRIRLKSMPAGSAAGKGLEKRIEDSEVINKELLYETPRGQYFRIKSKVKVRKETHVKGPNGRVTRPTTKIKLTREIEETLMKEPVRRRRVHVPLPIFAPAAPTFFQPAVAVPAHHEISAAGSIRPVYVNQPADIDYQKPETEYIWTSTELGLLLNECTRIAWGRWSQMAANLPFEVSVASIKAVAHFCLEYMLKIDKGFFPLLNGAVLDFKYEWPELYRQHMLDNLRTHLQQLQETAVTKRLQRIQNMMTASCLLAATKSLSEIIIVDPSTELPSSYWTLGDDQKLVAMVWMIGFPDPELRVEEAYTWASGAQPSLMQLLKRFNSIVRFTMPAVASLDFPEELTDYSLHPELIFGIGRPMLELSDYTMIINDLKCYGFSDVAGMMNRLPLSPELDMHPLVKLLDEIAQAVTQKSVALLHRALPTLTVQALNELLLAVLPLIHAQELLHRRIFYEDRALIESILTFGISNCNRSPLVTGIIAHDYGQDALLKKLGSIWTYYQTNTPELYVNENIGLILPYPISKYQRIIKLGHIVPEPSYYVGSVIYPVGFESQILFTAAAANVPNGTEMYTCSISESPEGPVFTVKGSVTGIEVMAQSPDEAWRHVIEFANTAYPLKKLRAISTPGLELFGLKAPLVIRALQCLPEARSLIGREMQSFRFPKSTYKKHIKNAPNHHLTETAANLRNLETAVAVVPKKKRAEQGAAAAQDGAKGAKKRVLNFHFADALKEIEEQEVLLLNSRSFLDIAPPSTRGTHNSKLIDILLQFNPKLVPTAK